jgi:serine protease Do
VNLPCGLALWLGLISPFAALGCLSRSLPPLGWEVYPNPSASVPLSGGLGETWDHPEAALRTQAHAALKGWLAVLGGVQHTEERPARPAINQPSPPADCAAPPDGTHLEDDEPVAVRPGAPRKGEPIHDRALAAYLEREGARLVKAGKLATNLLGQTRRKRCELELVSEALLPQSSAQIAQRAEDAVMVVARFYLCDRCSKTHFSSSTGFMLSRSGAMATSLHVLGQSNFLGMAALSRDGNLYPVREVLASDPLNDSVILQLEGKNFTPLPLATGAAVGSGVTVISHPAGHYYTLSTGVVSRHLVRRRARGLVSYIAVTAPFGAGSSGAPVFDERGAVIAMVNNTEAVYADRDGPRQRKDFQISIFNCTPAQALLDLAGSQTGKKGR